VLSVLIADDEPHVVELVRVTLQDERVHVYDAANGETALVLADTLIPKLVLLDVHLPDVSGLEVCRALRSRPRLAAVRIVMLTARPSRTTSRAGSPRARTITSPNRSRRCDCWSWSIGSYRG